VFTKIRKIWLNFKYWLPNLFFFFAFHGFQSSVWKTHYLLYAIQISLHYYCKVKAGSQKWFIGMCQAIVVVDKYVDVCTSPFSILWPGKLINKLAFGTLVSS
jgi:hypothetical protein